jgi:hypothetical protein
MFSKLEESVREYFVDLECEILEESVPLTVGVEIDDEVSSDEAASDDGDEYDDDDY